MQINSLTNNTTVQSRYSGRNAGNGDFRGIMAGNVENGSSHVVYLKKDDMLYSGGNGMGLSFYLKYAEDSTEDDPHILAKGIDEFGKEFEQVIDVKKVNPRNATLPEMRALEAYSGANKRFGFSSLPLGSANVGLNQRQDFIEALKKNIADMNTLGEYGIAQEYNKILQFYEGYISNTAINKDYGSTTGGAYHIKLNNIEISLPEKVKNNNTVDFSNFKEVETKNYKLVPEPDVGGLRIYVNGKSAGLFYPENLKIQEDGKTGTKVLVSEIPGFNDSWYDAIPATGELEMALAEAAGVEEIPHQELEGYYIGTHTETGIKYLMRPGDEGRGGKVLLCNATDEARFKALSEEYERRYPNLMSSAIGGSFYASLEIRGMAHRGANGIVKTHPDGISYNDNDDPKKNWSAKIDEKTWSLMLSWLRNHTLNSDEMTGFKYWDGIFGEIGGSYERIWSDDELKQGYLYQ